jgi:serine protease
MRYSFTILFLFIFSQYRASGFKAPETSSKSIIVMFHDGDGIEELKLKNLNWVELITPTYLPYHIYKIQLKLHSISESDAIKIVSDFPFVNLVQENRKLDRREIAPNDTFFPQQWNMDIMQLRKAWDISTGGVTAKGDTIVIAIIDDGFDLDHPDFEGNIWINHNEIPGDSIDNDSNGYIDDYWGWNTYLDNDEIFESSSGFASHGMPIYGIIGARGNNEIGIAGINWNTKLMTVVGGGFEDNAIKSYGYVITQKKRYLETQGQEGAFIVSTNSSWGEKNKFPADAPIWCALYDSLGNLGILNVAAPLNDNIDVGINGDLPTLCPSSFILNVTGTQNNDERAGYGFSKTFVHLGAPGRSLFSTRSQVSNVNMYSGGISGNSYAAPHVAALPGLIYAAACDSFIEYARQYPDSATLWVKYFILKGVDSLPSLTDFTITGGRANAYKPLLLLQDWCQGKLNPLPTPTPIDTTPKPLDTIPPVFYTIYPNPGSGDLFINGNTEVLQEVVFVNMEGKQFFSQRPLILNKITTVVETPNAKGVYVVNLYDARKNLLDRFKWVKY